MKPTLAYCTWDDAHGSTSMFDEHDVDHKPYRFTSVGFLVRSDDVGVSLAGEIGEDGRFRDHTFIPRKMVIDEGVIGPLKMRKKAKFHPQPPSQDTPQQP